MTPTTESLVMTSSIVFGASLAAVNSKWGLRALAHGLGTSSVAANDSGDMWFALLFTLVWCAIVAVVFFFAHQRVDVDAVSDSTRREEAAAGPYRTAEETMQVAWNFMWLNFTAIVTVDWFSSIMCGAVNDGSAGWMFASVLISVTVLAVAWAVLWSCFVFPARMAASDDDAAATSKSEAALKYAYVAFSRGIVFVFGGTWGYLLGFRFPSWWASVVFAKPGRGVTGMQLGYNFAATLVISLVILTARALATAAWASAGYSSSRSAKPLGPCQRSVRSALVTMYSAFDLIQTLCWSLWVTYGAIVSLSRLMTNEPPPFASTNPYCPTRVDVYPSNSPGESLLLVLIISALTQMTKVIVVQFICPGSGGGGGVHNKTASGDEDDGGAREPSIVHFTIGLAFARLIWQQGVQAMGQAVMCNPDQRFASRLAGTVVVLPLALVAYTLVGFARSKSGC